METRLVFESRVVAVINNFRGFIKLGPIAGICLYPYMLFARPAKQVSNTTLTHEQIHFWQVEKYGWFTFYFSYICYYLINIIVYKEIEKAYRNIPWEIEAYKLATTKKPKSKIR